MTRRGTARGTRTKFQRAVLAYMSAKGTSHLHFDGHLRSKSEIARWPFLARRMWLEWISTSPRTRQVIGG